MTVKFTNNASSSLASGINSTATSLTVADASTFPSLSGADDYCYLTIQQATATTREVVKATARSGNSFTIQRGVDNTTAASFSSGDTVELRLTSALLQDVIDQATVEGIKTNFQYVPTSGQTQFSGADSSGDTMIINDSELVNVYMNGVRLVQGSDYTVSSANNRITLTSGATTADIIDIEVFGNFTGQSGAAVAITGGAIAGTAITTGSINNTPIGATQANTVAATTLTANSALLGKSSSSFTTAGVELNQGGTAGKVQIQRALNPLVLSNLTNDGTIIGFYKSTALVGTIATTSNRLSIGSNDVGIFFDSTNERFTPIDQANQVDRDAAIDLGYASSRFKDLYLSGSVIADTIQNASGNLSILSTQNILLKFDHDSNQTNRELNIQSNSGDQILQITEAGTATFSGTVQATRLGANASPSADYGVTALQNGSMTHAGYFQANGDDFGVEVNATAGGGYSSSVLYVRQSSRNTGGNLARFANSDGDQFVVTTSGRVGIGEDNPNYLLSLNGSGNTFLSINTGNNSGDNSQIKFGDSADDDAGYINYDHQNNKFQFRTNGGANALVIGNTGGASFSNQVLATMVNNIDHGLSVAASGADSASSRLRLTNNGADVAFGRNAGSYPGAWVKADNAVASGVWVVGSTSATAYYQSAANDTTPLQNLRFLIDASGNVMAGTTDTTLFNNTTGGGIALMASNRLDVARVGDVVATFNRMSSDGSILQFYVRGVRCGDIHAIGTNGMAFAAPSSSGAALIVAGAANIVYPGQNNNGTVAVADNAIDLGTSGVRFKDIWIGGNINHLDLGGNARVLYTKASNLLGNGGTNVLGYQVQANHTMFAGTSSPRSDIRFTSGTAVSTKRWGFGGGISGTNDVYYIINESNVGQYMAHGSQSWTAHSDERIKENIVDVGTVLPSLMNMRCVKYNLISNPDDTKIGFIAQDWESSFPEVVDENDHLVLEDDGTIGTNDESDSTTPVKAMAYTETIPLLLKAIQELSEKVDQQAARIAELEGG